MYLKKKKKKKLDIFPFIKDNPINEHFLVLLH